ncbi:MAG: exodeoxyribonuclease I [Gammaproteobacteria bacterium]|nr:exodeoxyribonuclease I [Gammaproteobacteria bacterium]
MQPTFFFYDYETTGINPKSDRIIQFAGVRTDLEFNIIAEPIVLYSKLSPEIIPSLEAVIITGITPEILEEQGLSEVELTRRIYREFSQANTCVAGYNNIRFDDEFTRYAFYRNFFDPYAREWQNNNSRFDLIDTVRLCCALRHENINWPRKTDDPSKISFKLEDLSKANNLNHYKAHDALSDVYATIELAKLIKQHQPKLLEYLLKARKKDFVNSLINISEIFNNSINIASKVLVHSSRMVSSEYFGTSVFLPLLNDPLNPNSIITWDLRYDPDILCKLPTDINSLKSLLYTPQEQLAPDQTRLHLKNIAINKVPALAPLNTIDNKYNNGYSRLNLNKQLILQRAELILSNKDKWYNLLIDLFSEKTEFVNLNVEHQLYDKFISPSDRALCNRVHLSPENKLQELQSKFFDSRLPELLFRYRARNYFYTLDNCEQEKWQLYCSNILKSPAKEFLYKANNMLKSAEHVSLINSWVNYINTLVSGMTIAET